MFNMFIGHLALFFLIFIATSLAKNYFSCDENIETIDDYIFLSSPNYPQHIDEQERKNCFFNLSRPGNYKFVWTNGNLCNIGFIIDGKFKYIEGFGLYDSAIQATTLSMALHKILPNDTICAWQAFQAVIFNFSDNSIVPRIPLSSLQGLYFPITSDLPKKWIFVNDISTPFQIKFQFDSDFENYYEFESNICDITNLDNAYQLCIPKILPEYFLNWHPLDDPTNPFKISITVNSVLSNKPTDCLFEQIDDFTWIFSNYDPINGYINNAHCFVKMPSVSGYQFSFWLDKYFLEERQDALTLETSRSFKPLPIESFSPCVAPNDDLLFRFDSDSSIIQAGVVLFIKKFECKCGESFIKLPCDGSKVQRTFLADNDIYHFCFINCSVQITVEEACNDGFLLLTNNYDEDVINNFITVNLIVNKKFYDLKTYLFLPFDSSSIYTLYYNANEKDSNNNFCGTSFELTFQRISSPTTISHVLNLTNYNHYIRQNLTDRNVIFEMAMDETAIKNGYHLEVFFIFDGSDAYNNIAVYLDNMTNYIGSVVDVENSPEYPMPLYIPGNYTHIYFYIKDIPKLWPEITFYFRIRELDTSNCFLSHNVIDLLQLADPNNINRALTMVNNGTEDCHITVITSFEDAKNFTMTNFWTNADNIPVKILDSEGSTVFQFHENSSTRWHIFTLTETMYKIILPSAKSLSIDTALEWN